MSVCETCPLAAVYDSAEELVKQVKHAAPERAMGGIAISRKSLELVSSKAKCEGVTISNTGQIDCPIRDLASITRSLATSTWNQSQFEVELSQGIVDSDSSEQANTIGQYL